MLGGSFCHQQGDLVGEQKLKSELHGRSANKTLQSQGMGWTEAAEPESLPLLLLGTCLRKLTTWDQMTSIWYLQHFLNATTGHESMTQSIEKSPIEKWLAIPECIKLE